MKDLLDNWVTRLRQWSIQVELKSIDYVAQVICVGAELRLGADNW